MCLATVYKEDNSKKEKIGENIAFVSFEDEKVILTDVLNRKIEVSGKPKTMNLTDGIIVF